MLIYSYLVSKDEPLFCALFNEIDNKDELALPDFSDNDVVKCSIIA